MPSATQKKRTWAACVCPVCRFVFRVPKNHDGLGVVCPACHYLLKLTKSDQSAESAKEVSNQSIPTAPREKKKTVPIVARSMDEAELQVSPDSQNTSSKKGRSASATSSRSSGKGKRRVRQKKAGPQSLPAWEQSGDASSSAKNKQGSPIMWIISGSLVGLAVVAIGAWLVIDTMKNDPAAKQDQAGQWVPDDSAAAEPKVVLTAEEKKVNQEIQDSIKTGVNALAESSVVVKKFLSAKTTEELRELVRFPETSMPRIEKWYKTHPLEATEVKEIGYGGRVTVRGLMVSLTLQMGDYTLKDIVLERTADGYKVDWGSWVVWTEMNWDELFTQRPTEPKQVLVRCSEDTYYNRAFRDDTKWLAVKMITPHSDRTFYGYIDRNDPLLMRFVRDLGSGVVPAILEIQYPENAEVGNQVQISKHVMTGWVVPPETDEEQQSDKNTKSQ